MSTSIQPSTMERFFAAFKRPHEPITVYEALFLWFSVMIVWGAAVRYIGRGIPNFVYMQWGPIALTMVACSRYFTRYEKISFSEFMGNSVSIRWGGELVLVSAACLLIGISSWAALVYISASMDSEWAFIHWGVNHASMLSKVKWSPSWMIACFISSVLLAPIIEEIVFRGFILRRLTYRYNLRSAILISSLLFGAIHIHMSFLGTFLHGIVYAIVAVRFGSLYASMIVHGTYNGLIFVLERTVGTGLFVDKAQIDSFTYWMPEIGLLVVGLAAVGAYLRFGLRFPRADVIQRAHVVAGGTSSVAPAATNSAASPS